MKDLNSILQENKRRNECLDSFYNPITGEGSPIKRVPVHFPDLNSHILLPEQMVKVDWIKELIQCGSFVKYSEKVGCDVFEAASAFTSERYRHDFEFWAASTIKIQDKLTLEEVPFILRPPQRKLLLGYETSRISEKPIRFIVDKARQWGGSTLTEIYMMWIQTIHKENWHMAICAQDDSAAKNISAMYSRAATNYPLEVGTITFRSYVRSPKNVVNNERGGIIGVGSYLNPDQFRSYNYPMVHLCIHPETEIPTNDGFTKFAWELQPGDVVITHSGKQTSISNVTISTPTIENGNGNAIEIKAWGQQPITVTPNHPIFTRRGWVRADELMKTDVVSLPKRVITHNIKSIQLPKYYNRSHGGGSIPKGSGIILDINEELGYLFGYYLAEGNIHYSMGEVRELSFTRHDKEVAFAERALIPIKSFTDKIKRKKRENTLTTIEYVSDVALSTYIYTNFKSKEKKTVPDWFFDCGEEFLRGVLAGYLCGDGSKSNQIQGDYELSFIAATTISSSIATQIRDIAISLGYGVASIDIKEAGLLYGRNCKKAYTLRWAGKSARGIRSMLGWTVPNNGKRRSEKSYIDKNAVWIKVRSIKKTTIKQVVDIEVNHDDHSFRTLSFSVKNSEVGIWQDTLKRKAANVAQSLRNTVPYVPYSMIVVESTAKGIGNHFHNEWLAAIEGKSRYTPVFVGWWEIEMYRTEIIDFQKFYDNMTEYDWFLWNLGATLEGINWYKLFQEGENYTDWQMKEEYPSTWEESFQSSGHRYFNPAYIQSVAKSVCVPEFVGDVFGDARMGAKALQNIRFSKTTNGNLSLWGLPDPKTLVMHRYAGFADIGGRTHKADYSVFRLIDRLWMIDDGDPEFILTWRGHLDQDLFAWKCAQLCMAFAIPEIGSYPLLAIESNSLKKEQQEGDHFFTVLNTICEHYPNIYIRNDREKVGDGFIPKYGFQTTEKSKGEILDAQTAAAREMYMLDFDQKEGKGYIEHDQRAINEMSWYEIKANGTLGAIDGKNDDIEICTAGDIWLSNVVMPKPFYVEAPKSVVHTSKVKRESNF